MLQIRLNKGPSSDGGPGVKSLPVETVTVACPDHLVIADLPVAKGLGSATSVSRVKTVGRRSRRQLGERVHFCVRCDFPIAVYGRLTPCEHAFCLDCARSDSICYLCDERIQKIQTIKLMEGIFICAAPHCLKSFLKKSEFESHIHRSHADLVHPKMKKDDMNESDAFSVKPNSVSDSSARPLQAPGFPPSSNPPQSSREDRARSHHSREQTPLRPLMPPRLPPYHGQNQSLPSDLARESTPQRPDGYNMQNPGPLYYQQPPSFAVPMNPGSMPLNRPPFSFPPHPLDGPPFTPNYEGTQSDPKQDTRSAEQGPLPVFPPGHAGPPGFSEMHQNPWDSGRGGGFPFEAMQGGQGVMMDGSRYPSDPQGRNAHFQGDYGRNSMDSRDGNGMMGSMPPPPPSHPQGRNDSYYSREPGHDGKNYGW